MTAVVNANNAIMGPFNVWVGAFGVTEPAVSNAALIADPGAGWTFQGGTVGGASWEIDHTITDLSFDQVIDPVGGRVTARSGMVNVNAGEATIALLATALDSLGTTTVGSGITSYTPGQPNAGTPLSYTALLLDGFAPLLSSGAAARRRVIFRKCLNQTKVVSNGDSNKQLSWALSFKMFYVSNSIDPYIVMDQTA